MGLKLPSEFKVDDKSQNGSNISISDLANFLSFVYHRIEKLNQERQYAKHYCSLLDCFKETSASFSFWYKNREIPIDLSPVVFSDLVVPGDPQISFIERDVQYMPTDLTTKLQEAMKIMDKQEK